MYSMMNNIAAVAASLSEQWTSDLPEAFPRDPRYQKALDNIEKQRQALGLGSSLFSEKYSKVSRFFGLSFFSLSRF